MKRQKPPLNFVIIGRGAWGSALGSVLLSNEHHVKFLDIESVQKDWDEAFLKKPYVLISTPFHAIEGVLDQLKRFKSSALINASKGIDRSSLKSFSGLASKHWPASQLASLSGPTFASEVIRQKPTACVIASRSARLSQILSAAFSTPWFRAYTSSDTLGVEICGALKNVLAIACGISDGLDLGDNARAALLTRGLREMELLVQIFGGRRSTVYGLAGVGDLWLTATGDLSRNRRFGKALAESQTIDVALEQLGGPAEGYYTVKQVETLARKKKIELPICHEVYLICFTGKLPTLALRDLMKRDLKAELAKSRKLP